MKKKTSANNSYLKVKNWANFQQYKDRDPKWIKLHRDILNNYAFDHLTEIQQVHLIKIWLLASKLDNKIPNDPIWIGRQIGAKSKVDVNQLVTSDFLTPYETVQFCTETYLEREEETYKEETETEEALSGKKHLPDDPTKHDLNETKEVLNYLNAKRASSYKPTQANNRLISARLKEGFSIEDLKRVIDNKIIEWGNSRKMEKYIRPSTLFNAEKFSQYAGEPDQDKDDDDITKPPSWMRVDDPIEGECRNG